MRRPIILITAMVVIAIFVYDSIAGYGYDRLEQEEGNSIRICGTVEKILRKDEAYYQLILDDLILENGERYDKRVLVHVYEEIPGYMYVEGAVVIVQGEACIPDERKNPGCFDYRKYLMSIGIRSIIKTEEYEIVRGPEGLHRIITDMRGRIVESLMKVIGGDEAGIIIGMMFGDKSYISDETMDMFRKGGTAHILAVSGLHIGIIYGFLLKFRRKKKSLSGDIAIASFLICYAALCWFTPSVLRAVAMIFIHMAGNHLHRRYDFTCCICASMLFFLIMNPYQVFNTGFQMSYLAAFVIAFIMPVIKKKVNGFMTMIVTMQIGMGPYIAYAFNYISLAAVLCNIPVSFFAAFMIPMAVCMIPLSFIGMEDTLAEVLRIPAELMIRCNELTYADGALCFDCISPPIWILFFSYAALFYLCSEDAMIALLRKNKRRIAAILTICLMTSCAFDLISDDGFGKCEYTFVDVGQGDCLHISDGGTNILVDGGGSVGYAVGEKTLKPYLLKNGAGHVDIAIATHLHMDHFQGLCELSRCYEVDTLAVYEGNRDKEEEIRKTFRAKNILYLKKGDVLNIGKRTEIKVMAPENGSIGDDEDENAESLVLKCSIGEVSVLMTGDIDEEGERKLMRINDDNDMRCSVLKAAHHGSRHSSCESFIDSVSPDIAVISVGKNNYGHPAQETLDKFKERNIPTYRTDRQGAIGIDADRKKIHTMK